MKQVAFVALYGRKPSALSSLISSCQQQITSTLGGRFQPYQMEQIHATLVGAARVPGSAKLNLNFMHYRCQFAIMDFSGWLHYLRSSNLFPFQVQIGGFRDADYGFTSRGQVPHRRSFSIQGDKFVLMGWPIRTESLAAPYADQSCLVKPHFVYPDSLDMLRRAAQDFNLLHSYHRESSDVDNDFYMRIGLLSGPPPSVSTLRRLEAEIRTYIGRLEPVMIDIPSSSVFVAAYEDETLPLASTATWPIDDPRITAPFLEQLYDSA